MIFFYEIVSELQSSATIKTTSYNCALFPFCNFILINVFSESNNNITKYFQFQLNSLIKLRILLIPFFKECKFSYKKALIS